MDARRKNLATMTTLVRIPFNLFFGKTYFELTGLGVLLVWHQWPSKYFLQQNSNVQVLNSNTQRTFNQLAKLVKISDFCKILLYAKIIYICEYCFLVIQFKVNLLFPMMQSHEFDKFRRPIKLPVKLSVLN